MRPELDQRGIDFDDLVGRVLTDPGAADIPRTRRAMLNYARKLTATPSAMTESDIHELRAAGFEDRDVLAIAEVVAYYAYANRIADGLGVQVEDWNRDDRQ